MTGRGEAPSYPTPMSVRSPSPTGPTGPTDLPSARRSIARPSTARPGIDEALGSELREISQRGLHRFLREVSTAQSPSITMDGREVLLFCSNNYLGLADDPRLIAASVEATRQHGTSAVSSRLISGHMSAHAELEANIARWKQREAALVFSTGFQANIGLITSLVGPDDIVISDELNHASIIDGCRLSRAKTLVYRHNDLEHLQEQLVAARGARRVLVITESIFSMDGDRAPLTQIVNLAKSEGAWVAVDEAHAAGLFGPDGAGVVAELGLHDQVDAVVGTLGKALGSFGAYVSGSTRLVDLLINRARSFIFTTALPPSAVAAANAAIEICRTEPERRARVLANAQTLGNSLRAAGLNVGPIESQIVPILVGEADATVALAKRLLEKGVYVAAIRPPTVPAGTSRLRLSLMATHSDQQINDAREAILQAVVQDAAGLS